MVIDNVQFPMSLNKDKINKCERRSKNSTPATFNNCKHLKGWAKIPIPKQIEDEERDRKQTKHNENKKKMS